MVWSINDGKLRIKGGITPDPENPGYVKYTCYKCAATYNVHKSELYTCWFCEESDQLDMFEE